MTLLEVIINSPKVNYLEYKVFVEKNSVWDFKTGEESLLLISESPCPLPYHERVNVQELIDHCKNTEYPEHMLTLTCEDTKLRFSTYFWSEDSLTLLF